MVIEIDPNGKTNSDKLIITGLVQAIAVYLAQIQDLEQVTESLKTDRCRHLDEIDRLNREITDLKKTKKSKK